MSNYTRLASTDEQEEAIQTVLDWATELGRKIVGATTIGKAPQTVILDLVYHGSDIYIDDDGRITASDDNVIHNSDDLMDYINEYYPIEEKISC